jgi:serine/threonine-protein kinase
VADLPTIDGFCVLEELGSGALSSVFKAIEETIGRTVALKVLKETISPSSPFALHLEHEAQMLGELCHPNIGLLYAFAKTDARLYLVLEFVEGFSLATLLNKRPTVPPDSVAAIGAAIARGLAHAHAHGIIHRDIKPANIMASTRGDVKIFDFGIARRASASDDAIADAPGRMDGAAFGTPAYMSPEQILGESVDARSDIFSLGIVLYQLICGARPFERGDETDRRPAANRIRRDPPIPLHRRAPEVPQALERIVMRAIEKLPVDRFQSAEVMAEQLEEVATARSGLPSEKLVVGALEHAGLISPQPTEGMRAPARSRRATVRRAITGLAVLGCTIGVSAGTIQSTAKREGEAAGTRPLELMPASPGYLRVLATPWAEVWVDGQRVEVTPFARGIPLDAGKHYVTLVHPNAPIEKRTVSIATGETCMIDVVMAMGEVAPTEQGSAQGPRAEKGR